MSNYTDDPFAIDDDRTILHPRHSQRSKAPDFQNQKSRAHKTEAASTSHGDPGHYLSFNGTVNPLENAASRLLPLLVTIKNSVSHPEPDKLRDKLIVELDQFEKRALLVLQDTSQVKSASYIMCTVLDEAVMQTPWGHDSTWAQQNLLYMFHKEVVGGERFFKLLKTLANDVPTNLYLLELMYICLSLGFQGSYRLKSDGQKTLELIKKWLYEHIRGSYESASPELSGFWKGAEVKENTLPMLTPLWVGFSLCLVLGSIAYFSFDLKLGRMSDGIVSDILLKKVRPLAVNTIDPPTETVARNTILETPFILLSTRLENEIKTNQLTVDEDTDHARIRLIGDNLFASGRSELNQNMASLIQRIAISINNYGGGVVVTGHSDNIPIRSTKNQSNLQLSRVRADSVLQLLLANGVNAERLRAEGMGSLAPIAENSTPEGRSQNRRVEIDVYY